MKQTLLAPKVISLKFSFLLTSIVLFFSTFFISCDNPQDSGIPINNLRAAVAYSSDSGNTWEIRYVSTDASINTMYSITSMDFGSTLTSLTENTLYRSEDTGVSWSAISPALFKNKIVGTGVMNSGILIGLEGNINYTSDNGKTFSQIQSGTTLYLNDIVIDSKTGYGYIAGDEIISKTTDYGESWFKASGYDSLGVKYYFHSIDMLDSNIVYAKGYEINDPGPKVVKSLDGFKNVSILELPYNESYNSLDITFFDENIGITGTSAHDGSIIRTSDGGLTWSKINIPTSNAMSTIKFIDNVCIATSNSKIHRSNDFGITWTTIQLSGSYGFHDIYSPSPGNIFMCGNTTN